MTAREGPVCVGGPLYADGLVVINADNITFRRYSLLFCRDRRVPFAEIAIIAVRAPSLVTGKWRLCGSRDFRTRFPLDWNRSSRDAIFLIELRGSRRRIGFTVEDSALVAAILQERGLLHGGLTMARDR